MQNRKVSSLVGINSGKCSKIFAESKFSALFFACCGRFPFPEPLFELLPAAEEQAEESPPQQRVVDVPPAYVGIAIQYVQERDGRAAQPPQVDHAFVGAQRPGVESHAVDVDQLEAVVACRAVVFPEDVGLVEILVADSLLMEADGEAGEGFEHGQRVRRREASHGLRERGELRPAGDEIGVGDQAVLAVFAPCHRFRGVETHPAQAQGVLVGAAGLVLAEERIHDPVEQMGAFVAFDDKAFAPDVESPDLVAPVVEHLARDVENLREPFDKGLHVPYCGIDRYFHDGVRLPGKVTANTVPV